MRLNLLKLRMRLNLLKTVETIDAVTLVPRARVQQRMAEKTGVGEAGPSRPRANGRNAVCTAVARLADEARPPGIAEQSATTNSDIAVSAEQVA